MPDARTILVTGAGGFIGGRMVEVMHALGVGTVRAGLRRWSSGARVGRFPVELVKCDVRNTDELRTALRGVTHVVHCAVGDRTTTVEGTTMLMAAAAEAGVRRVVHISSIDVYGAGEGEFDESSPLILTGRDYGDSKIEAEDACQASAAAGLPVTILRPTLVHGPFSTTWTIAYAQRLQSRPWLVAEADAQGICNLVYVDDLVGAVLAVFDADLRPGEAFNISGPESPTWHQYFRALNDAIGLPPLVSATPTRARLKAMVVQPFRQSAKLLLKHFQPQIMAIYERSTLAQSVMKRAEGLIRGTPAPSEFEVYSRRAKFPIAKAERLLAYRPRFRMADALPLTASWLDHHGFIANASD